MNHQPAVIQGDCIEVMRTFPDNSVDAIVTDPPYGLGFMGKAWDALPPGLEWAEECLRVLKPGGHLLAFGGTRTWHRLAVAVEDAGFELRDSIAWLYGSGFPKSQNVGKSAGPEWEGWGTALKPAFEPVVVARKPLVGTVAANVLLHGTGAINVDASRIATDGEVLSGGTGTVGKHEGWDRQWMHDGKPRDNYRSTAGRFPANVILDESQAVALDEQSGDRSSPWVGNRKGNAVGAKGGKLFGGGEQNTQVKPEYGDTGGASRFFYCAKASKSERPVVDGVAHPTVKPLALMRYLVKLVTPPGGTVLDPFAGSGTTLEAAMLEGFHSAGIERETEYLPLIQARIDRQATP